PSLAVSLISLFFFTHPAPPEIYTLSLHDALPIYLERLLAAHALEPPLLQEAQEHQLRGRRQVADLVEEDRAGVGQLETALLLLEDRKSTRLNSSHDQISYAVFCLKKKKKKKKSVKKKKKKKKKKNKKKKNK